MRSLLSALSVSITVATASAAVAGPTVIELYTSQGCSSCPPADAMLVELADKDDVIALSLHVDYWDYLGWQDDLANPAYTERQQAFASAAGSRTVYTPQMVIGGKDHVIGSKPMQVMDRLRAHDSAPDPVEVTLSREGNQLTIVANAEGIAGDAVVQIVRYWPMVERDIRRGENAGRTIAYANVVYSWQNVGIWNVSAPLEMEADIDGTEPVAVIIQAGTNGPVLGAAQLR